MYFEVFDTPHLAAKREKQIKAGSRRKKIELINKLNPDWHDLFCEISSEIEKGEIASSR